jgi:hypothetical protein
VQNVLLLNNNRSPKLYWMIQDEYDWHLIHTDRMADTSPDIGPMGKVTAEFMQTSFGNNLNEQGPNGPNAIIVGWKSCHLLLCKFVSNYYDHLISARTSGDTPQNGSKNKKRSRCEQKSSNTGSRNTNAR